MIREEFELLIKSLAATPEKLQQMVENLLDDELRWKPAAEVFSCLEHAWHLNDIEREAYAARIWKLLHEKQPFLSDIDGDKLARERNYNNRNLEFALDQFSQARKQNVRAICDLSTDQLQRSGTFENVGPITLEKLLLMMVEHDNEHLRALGDLRSQLFNRRS